MKKIISILLLSIFIGTNFSFAQEAPCNDANDIKIGNSCCSPSSCDSKTETVGCRTENGGNIGEYSKVPGPYTTVCKKEPTSCSEFNASRTTSTEAADCGAGKVKKNFSSTTTQTEYRCCAPEEQTANEESSTSTSVMGIECDQDKLVNGQCKLNIYNTLGIRKSTRDTEDSTSVGLFVQDIVLSATFFIGTLVTIALVVSGIMFIFAASSGKDPANAKKGIIGSLVGLLIVVSSYVIIRLVQYIAKGF